jgi:protein-tyrosine phosphatase
MFDVIRAQAGQNLHRRRTAATLVRRTAAALIDTHSHLLPWVDHGCPDLETCLLMAREAAASGISTVVCTPHLPELNEADIRRTREVIDEVRAAVAAADIELALLLGFEVDLVVAATTDPNKLDAVTIEGSGGAIVLEMPFSGWPLYLEETIFRLSTAGLRPVLAHPERNDRIQKSSDLLAGCLKAGAVAQATAASLGGEFGRSTEKTLFKLLSEGLIGLVASDAHAYRTDRWTLASVLETLSGIVSEDDLTKLVERNPRRLLAGEGLLRVGPVESGGSWQRRGWRPRAR